METMYARYIKRWFDVVLALLGLIVLLPVYLVIGIAIKLDSKGPILFRQRRVGKDRKLFEILKFRTMRTDTPHDLPTHLLSDPEAYITRAGRVLRRTSLDELPQIWNILVGEMSVIGPRPALWNQDDLVAEREKYGANSLRPGLTGWAQINGRDELEIPEKAKLDGEYVKRLSFGFDCKCFWGTIASVLSHDGVVEGGTGVLHRDREELRVALSISSENKRAMRGGARYGRQISYRLLSSFSATPYPRWMVA